ncbi:MAG: indole-3-glycerol phosphate synthase TrpC [Dehalococcoidia bacterium]|nr:indole-3-glycerol phosphate synthase TrpC [Dehalococcoidia bacterium]
MSTDSNVLDRIVSSKRLELEQTRRAHPLPQLFNRIAGQTKPLDFAVALRGQKVRLIAEVKKASPSKGLLCPLFDPLSLAGTYAENGAAAISVLTESQHFLGSTEHLTAIRQAQTQGKMRKVPLLRKDFLFDPYQIYESRAIGADALLLIVAVLGDTELRELLQLSRQLGMRCLVEVHNEDEVERAVSSGAGIIGINNRDLKTFVVDIATTERLRPLILGDRIVVSESGIETRADMDRLRRCKVHAALVGEALVTASDVAAKVRELA